MNWCEVKSKKPVLFGAGALALFILLFYLKHRFHSLNYSYLIIGIAAYSAVLLTRSFKINQILKVYTDIRYKETLPLTASSQLMGAFIPGRAGEVLVSAYLKFKYRVDVSKILPVLFLDKIIELLVVLIYSLMAIFMVSQSLLSLLSDSVHGIRDNYLLIAIIIVAVLILLLAAYKLLGSRLKIVLANVKNSLLIPIRNPKLGAVIIAASFLAYITEYLYLYCIFHAFNVEISLPKVILVHSLGMVIGVVSMIPGGQGSTEVTMLAVLHLWGYTTLSVITPILASKFITYFILAMYGLPLLPYSFSVLKERRRRAGKKVSNE
ncbi:hypothetical protein SAMN03159358_3660 [Paenibacillus sp. NFR01]|nr:hypothetical protein SAMN03159358_3660 [Paenibacillus sp. NFR01]